MSRFTRLLPSRTRSRFTASALCLAVAVLHPVPPSMLFRCLVTGEILDDCCCKATSSCCELEILEPASCCEAASANTPEPERHDEPNELESTLFVAAACSCCDVIRRDGTTPPTLGVPGHREISSEPVFCSPTLLVDGLVSLLEVPVVAKSRTQPPSKPPPPKIPHFLLHQSFLL